MSDQVLPPSAHSGLSENAFAHLAKKKSVREDAPAPRVSESSSPSAQKTTLGELLNLSERVDASDPHAVTRYLVQALRK